jgi:hypothetical protein
MKTTLKVWWLVLFVLMSTAVQAQILIGAAVVGARGKSVTPAEATAIAKEAWLYAYAPLQGYQTFYNQTQNKDFPGYVGGVNRFRHYSRLATPADTDIVTPNNDTPYSWAWLDLRAEPFVLSLPAEPSRYYVNQWFDLYTHNFAYTGMRSTGREAGNYLFAGPRWKGPVPKGITQVFRSETDFIGTLTRTQLLGAEDVPAMQAMQAKYKLQPLSAFTGSPPPAPAAQVAFMKWDAEKAQGIQFISYLNALLPFMPTPDSEKDMFNRFSRIGIGAGKAFDADKLKPEIRNAIEQGIAQASQELKKFASEQTDSSAFFGTRKFLGTDYVMKRAAGAMLGIYANSKEEAVYGAYQMDSTGKPLDGTKRWVLRFAPGQLPPTSLFWSITMYRLPERLLAENPINRYSIGDKTPGLKQSADGSLVIYIQRDNPGPDKESNWLPTPGGPFFIASRYYGPKPALADGTWKQPMITPVD